jgi:hypothetical protein
MSEELTVTIVNLGTGETREVDAFALVDRGLPERWSLFSGVTRYEWLTALRSALGARDE